MYNASWKAVEEALFQVADLQKFPADVRAQLVADLQRIVKEKGLASHVEIFYSQMREMGSEVRLEVLLVLNARNIVGHLKRGMCGPVISCIGGVKPCKC